MIDNSRVAVLIPLTWDENKWECGEEFIRSRPQYKLLKDYFQGQEKIIFGHKKYPLEGKFPADQHVFPPSELPPDPTLLEGTYVGYSRMISQMLDKGEDFYWNSDDFKAVFFVSTKTETYIVGFYLFPMIDWGHARRAKHEVYNYFTFGNIRSKGEDIVRFDNYLQISNIQQFSSIYKLLKKNKYAYTDSDGILTILEEAIKLNPDQKDLKSAAIRLKKNISKSVKGSKT
ncbi:MAG: hypothetical protein NTU51_00805 [Bacteroidetes bacterium]|nr:hypothetical protein [Bacteroidota bacterium]